MTFDRAHAIVSAICARSFCAMGLGDPAAAGSLAGVTLAEMIAARDLVEEENAIEAARAAAEGGSRTIHVVPDDRLIAAAYALENYGPGRAAIAVAPGRMLGVAAHGAGE